jgi:hypothetical protein
MKTMTCRQMGGPCDEKLQGGTPEEIMDKGAAHLRQMTDPEHVKAREQMEAMPRDSDAGRQWNDQFMKLWNDTPDDAA